MSPAAGPSQLAAYLRQHPVAATLELGTVVCCVLLFVGTFLALASGPPTGRGDLWLALIGMGSGIVLLWTVFVPVYERTL